MEELTLILEKATKAIEGKYFQLSLDGGDPVYRERLYCYELYHQMRCLWPNTDFYLNGEVDKAAHPILKKWEADRKKPDFLVHTPGSMAGNNTIIEVKHIKSSGDNILKDLETLTLFVTKVGYKRAILLFFGYDTVDNIVAKVRKQIKNVPHEVAPFELWFHYDVGKKAIQIEI